ncbi:MAG: PEP-CTERM sorting domain-containing protein [Planctomycetia bacterium]|nr:PEP-CTERM sorting domain-containing protein [Planctomycetia bacterium]
MKTLHIVILWGLLLSLALFSGTRPCVATDIYWNAEEGYWDNGANWQGGAAPGSADVGYINNGGIATIRYGTELQRISVSHSNDACTGTLVIDAEGATISNTSSLTVGRNAGNGTIQMKNGTLNVTGAAVIAGCDNASYLTTNNALFEQTGGTVNFNNTVRLAGKSSGGTGKIQISGGTMYIKNLTSTVNDSGVALENGSTGLLSISGNANVTVDNINTAKGTTIQVSGGSVVFNGLSQANTLQDTKIAISGGEVTWNIDSSASNTVFTNLTTILTGGTLNVTGNNLKNYNSTLIVAGGTVNVAGTGSIQSGSAGAGTYLFIGGDYTMNYTRWGMGTAPSGTRNTIEFLATSGGIAGMESTTTTPNENFYTTDVKAGIAGGMALMDASSYSLIRSKGIYVEPELDSSSVWELTQGTTNGIWSINATLDAEKKKGTIDVTGDGVSMTLEENVALGSLGWLEMVGEEDRIQGIGWVLLNGGEVMTDVELTEFSQLLNQDAYGSLETVAENGVLWMKNLSLDDLASHYLAYDFTPYGAITVSGILVESTVPEPSTWVLIFMGFGWILWRKGRGGR